ncbi:kinase-like protein [Artomyces pyxidatus]|uniref:Kinase-like protein n=1 Tax=Artomyces pyxidatus TaxID=48021 RepID=A0ACB8T7H3_9AGAM|nr:kinase-like protein [Artomyces pyxidatus]
MSKTMDPNHTALLRARGYTVHRELGSGRTARVWLAAKILPKSTRVRPDSHYSEQLVAIKIVSRAAKRNFKNEVSLLQEILVVRQLHPVDTIALYIESFCSSGPDELQCIVTEALGTSLETFRCYFADYCLPLLTVKPIIRDILTALDFLHTKCNVTHTDINFNNVLFTRMIDRKNFRTSPLTVKLIDFGQAVSKGVGKGSIQPLFYRAPEVMIGADWDWHVDIWNVGCLVFELLTGCSLFRCQDTAHFEDGIDQERDIIGCMVVRTGTGFQGRFLMSGQDKLVVHFFTCPGLESGDYNFVPRATWTEVNTIDGELASYLQGDHEPSSTLIQAMVRLNPNERPTARELLASQWF